MLILIGGAVALLQVVAPRSCESGSCVPGLMAPSAAGLVEATVVRSSIARGPGLVADLRENLQDSE
ncbi:MAG: hypothetical protein ACC661_00515 [Verrucomicrobiales bacterium]